MDSKERKSIDELASEVRKYIIGQGNNFNLDSCLEARGVEIRYFKNEKYDAFLKWDKELKKPIISVNMTQAPARQRFSIAHELGHLILDWKWIPGSDLSDKNEDVLSIKYRGADNYTTEQSKNETCVNEFAAAFLIPDNEIKNLLNNSNQVRMTEMIKKIAKKFGVSEEAADIRLTNYLYLRN